MEGDVRISAQLTSPADAVAWIAVASPSSPQRLESMQAGAFHIGRSKSCHLRLGDDSIPDLLAVIIADKISARVSCQCSSPQLLLNGEPIEDSPLSDGDLLEAGPYTLVFRRIPVGSVSANYDDTHNFDVSQANAPELIEALEEELAVVEELEHTPFRGLQELASHLAQSNTSDTTHRDVIPINDVQSLLLKLDKGQQSLRLQQDAILQEFAKLQQQQLHLLELLQPPADAVVPIRPVVARPSHRASA